MMSDISKVSRSADIITFQSAISGISRVKIPIIHPNCDSIYSSIQLQIDLFLQFASHTFKILVETICSHYGKIIDIPKTGIYIIYHESYHDQNN